MRPPTSFHSIIWDAKPRNLEHFEQLGLYFRGFSCTCTPGLAPANHNYNALRQNNYGELGGKTDSWVV